MPGSILSCRRCGKPYAIPPRAPWLPACPHCGASPRPLLHMARHNAVAAVLALAALGVLSLAFIKPFMQMDALGSTRVLSLLGGIADLYREGHTLIATVILLFSVIFPVAKLGLILAATSRLAPLAHGWRHKLHKIAAFTGKYSLLDVLVLAILVVMVKFKGVAEVQMRIGTILFCIAVLLSLAAGLCVNLTPNEPGHEPETSTQP